MSSKRSAFLVCWVAFSLVVPASGQRCFSVEAGGPADWPSAWTEREFSSIHAMLLSSWEEVLQPSEPSALLDAMNRLAPALREAVVYGGVFVGYGAEGQRLYRFDEIGGEPSEQDVQSWIQGRIHSRIRVRGFVEPTHPASSVLVRCDAALADRVQSTPAGRRIFDGPGRPWRLRAAIRVADGPVYAAVEPESEIEELPGSQELVQLLAEDGVEWAESDYTYVLKEGKAGAFRPDDEYFAGTQQWALWAIQAPHAWRYVHASPAIVAVLDTGIESSHPDISCNLWRDPADGSIGIDLTPGAADPSSPEDTDGHGTHMAGIIGGTGDNAIGITGVCWRVELMTIRVADHQSASYVLETTAKGIDHALEHDADIINLSWVLLDPSELVHGAIVTAGEKEVLVVVPAGRPQDSEVYPACYDDENILAVMGVDDAYEPFQVSAVDPAHVDLAAPAASIMGPLLGGTYGPMDGVSTATALVSGAAALLKGHPKYAAATAKDLKQALIDGARPVEALKFLCKAGGVLDLGFVDAPVAGIGAGGPMWDSITGKLTLPPSESATGTVIVDTATLREGSPADPPAVGTSVELILCQSKVRDQLGVHNGETIMIRGTLVTLAPSGLGMKVLDFE